MNLNSNFKRKIPLIILPPEKKHFQKQKLLIKRRITGLEFILIKI